MTYLCVPIFVSSVDHARRDALRAAEHGADLLEYRVDAFDERGQIAAGQLGLLLRESPLPCIVTCRAPAEGGKGTWTDAERLELIAHLGADAGLYVDLELQTHQRHPQAVLAAAAGRRLILSSHDFKGRPDRLYNIIADLAGSPADVIKLVWTARTVRDNIETFELLSEPQRPPTIALCMGEAGLISRILAKKFGAFLTFASLSQAAETAPGQVSIADIKDLYRWDAITPRTKVYGVVGSPVAHSMSPALHNAAFAATNVDAIYLPLLVNEGYESFKAFMESFLAFAPLDLAGLSITIPHKENALRYLTEKGGKVDDLAKSIGAINTIVIHPLTPSPGTPGEGRGEGSAPRLHGFSTDYAAILDSITTKLSITRDQLKTYRIAVLGAGGTGRTAVAALAHYGATVVVYNRTRARADALAAEFTGRTGKVVAADWEKLCDSCCQVFLNTTPIGMHPNINASPLDGLNVKLTPEHLVFDAIYNPPRTKLLADAQAAGAQTIGGVEMFVRQAAGQFHAWTDKPPPTDLMRQVVESRLARAFPT